LRRARASSTRRSTTAKGRAAERRARLHYLLRGYRILAVNARAGGNELDIVVRRGGRLVFCEVKAKSSERYGHPFEMVGPEKQRRLRHAAEAWLHEHPQLCDLRLSFEVAAVRGRRLQRLRDAF
jgi:putative endonuclease